MRVVLVSGCSTGIGRCLADRFAALGDTVVAGARNPCTLEDLAARHPGRLHPIAWDVADEEATRGAVASTIARFGRIDVLINNAGYGQMGPLVELSRDAWRRQLETNVVGLADAAAMAARLPGGMIERRAGRIVNIGSIVGRVSIPFGGAYAATKHAVEAISDALRMELAPFGVDVVLVEPGPIETAFTATAGGSMTEILARRDSPYEYLRDVLAERASSGRPMSMSADDCAGAIVRAVTRRRPPTRLRVTGLASLMFWLRRLLPDRAIDSILKPRFGLSGRAPR
ncbi:MAG: SDR family oxidoreductase [Acidobacteria bacterium]|nr:SDR family oxidoreductase [Acidobacteriota bacterium]